MSHADDATLADIVHFVNVCSKGKIEEICVTRNGGGKERRTFFFVHGADQDRSVEELPHDIMANQRRQGGNIGTRERRTRKRQILSAGLSACVFGKSAARG